MQCPECQFENPGDSNFCLECGQKLEQKCPQCEKSLPAAANFCNGCGHKLTAKPTSPPKDLSFDEKLDKIQKYLPKGLTEKILSQKDRIEGERKQVTVMFCDMEGFTQLSEKLGPEDAYTIMDKVYEILIHKVHDYEGTVNEMTGDGIMALFGAPITLEDAPQRAIRSSLSIHREMTKFNDELKHERDNIPPIRMRIGVHNGPVVVGTLGNDLRVEFKAVGDTVNIASRMEGLAEPGTTYITGDTFKLTEGFFRFEALGNRKIKGREEPVQIYRVIAPSTRRTRFDVSAERGLTPFVGRERELELLLDGFERAKEGRGQAFSIVSEAGVGKSRLLYEFRKAVINEDATFLEGKCLSYSKNVVYHPVIDILKSNFDIKEGDADNEIKDKVINGLKILGVDEASTLPYILDLLSVKDSGIDTIPMSPEARKDRTIEAVKKITLKGSEIRPLIIAIEDLHWMDNSSEDFLKSLLGDISGAKIFLIFTYRPEFMPKWGGKSYHNQVNLNRFSNRESLTMATNLLGKAKIGRDLKELILEKTEGVPFFIEEFLRSFQDIGIINRKNDTYYLFKDIEEVAIPNTIHDVIMARVDSLPDMAKNILQTGSVIEREFNYELMRRVSKISKEELLSQLSVLKDSELLYERGIYPENTFIFKHALTREVVYSSILESKKKKLHEQIGITIEVTYKDNIDDYYGILVEHFLKSENFEKASEYSKLAYKKAQKRSAFSDAISYAKKSIACLERLPQSEEITKKIIDSRTTLGFYYIQTDCYVDAKDAVDPIVELTLKRNYKRRVGQIHTILGTSKFQIEEDFHEAFNHYEQALKISEQVNDIATLFLTSWTYGAALALNCEFRKALQYIGQALHINTAANILWGISVMQSSQSYCCYNYQGKIDLAYRTTKRALQLAEESADSFSKSIVYPHHGCSCYHKGLFSEAEEYLLKGVEFCKKINSNFWNSQAHQYLGDTYFEIGQYQKSKNQYETAIQLLEQNRYSPSWIGFAKISVARAKVMINNRDIDLDSFINLEATNKIKLYQSSVQRYIGEILINMHNHDLEEAEGWIRSAFELDSKNGMMWHLAQDYALLAELLNHKGDQPKAKENLGKAVEIFKGCGADGWVEKYEKTLAAL